MTDPEVSRPDAPLPPAPAPEPTPCAEAGAFPYRLGELDVEIGFRVPTAYGQVGWFVDVEIEEAVLGVPGGVGTPYGASAAGPRAAAVVEAPRPGPTAGPARSRPPGRPLRVIHVGQSMVRAGIEQWLKALIRHLDPSRVQVTRCIATNPKDVDPAVVREMGVPVEVGQRECVRRAARECDVLLAWGPTELGEWVADCRPGLCVFVAHGEADWTRRIVEGCAPVVDHVVAVSDRVFERNCGAFPTTVIPNGVDLAHLSRSRSREQSRLALGFKPGDFVLGFVGRFSPEKRPEAVIDAVAELPDDFKALLVGWGPMYRTLQDRANRLIPGRYAFATPGGPVGDYYEALDALCLVSDEEGFGLVVLEAMMCERPVIVTEVGGVPDMVRDRVSGLVVPGSPGSVRDAALLLRRHPHWARGLAAEAKAYAEAHGHASLMARRYEDLLLRLWAERPNRTAPPPRPSPSPARNGLALGNGVAH